MSGPDGQLRGLRVLIIEDELLIAMELQNLLRELGADVLDLAPTVPRALGALEQQRPDVAVLDVNLHGERVTPVAEVLQEQGVPFVLVTGYGSERLSEGALQGVPCLRKPIDACQLAAAISVALNGVGGGPEA
jgi:CheY-like chemotaxis protein